MHTHTHTHTNPYVCKYGYIYIYIYNDYRRWANPPKALPGAAQTPMPNMGMGASMPNPMGMQVYFISLHFFFWLRHLKYAHGCQLYFRLSAPLSPPAPLPSSQLRLFLSLTPSLSVPFHCLLPPLPPPACLSLLPLFVPLTPSRALCRPRVCVSTHTQTHTHWTHSQTHTGHTH
jgi:hypothetical protein